MKKTHIRKNVRYCKHIYKYTNYAHKVGSISFDTYLLNFNMKFFTLCSMNVTNGELH